MVHMVKEIAVDRAVKPCWLEFTSADRQYYVRGDQVVTVEPYLFGPIGDQTQRSLIRFLGDTDLIVEGAPYDVMKSIAERTGVEYP